MGWIQIAVYLVVLVLLAKPLGEYMARVYAGEGGPVVKFLRPMERGIYRLCRIRSDDEMSWKVYALSMLAFNLLGILVVYALQRFQDVLPLNPPGCRPSRRTLRSTPPSASVRTRTGRATPARRR